VINLIERMLTLPRDFEAPCLLVEASSGWGKSSLIHHMKVNRFKDDSGLIYMSYAKNANGDFNLQLANTLNLPPSIMKVSSTEVSAEIQRALELRQIKGLVIDDIHDVVLAQKNFQRINLALIRSLTEGRRPISIFGLGTLASTHALNSDEQLWSRFVLSSLPKWTESEEFVSFLNSVEENLPLRQRSDLFQEKKVQYLLSQCKGNTRLVMRTIRHAAIWAVCEGIETINLDMLILGYTRPFQQTGWCASGDCEDEDSNSVTA
jgi:hypothetical protein